MMYMKSNILKFLSSPVTCLLLMIVYACGLAAATFIEKQLGTETAKVWCNIPRYLFSGKFLMVVNFVAMTWKYQLISRKNGARVDTPGFHRYFGRSYVLACIQRRRTVTFA